MFVGGEQFYYLAESFFVIVVSFSNVENVNSEYLWKCLIQGRIDPTVCDKSLANNW